jgi:hypothetical protein
MLNSPAASTVYLQGTSGRKKRTEQFVVSDELSRILTSVSSTTQRRALCAIDRYGIELVKFKNGFTALHWAARMNRLDICKYLLSRKGDPNARDDHNKIPFDYATSKDIRDLLRPENDEVLLHQIVDMGSLSGTHQKCLKTIATYGWSSLKWGGGWTILHWAYQEERQDIIDFLKLIGVPLEIPDDKGRLPVYYDKSGRFTRG